MHMEYSRYFRKEK